MTKSQTAKAPPAKKPPLTDSERHQRFKDMAREVDAAEDDESFDRAFASIDPRHKSED